MARIAGVDGYRGGWVGVLRDLETGQLIARRAPALRELAGDALILAVDIPIGVPDRDRREADRQARRFLGVSRQTAVCPSPPRTSPPQLEAWSGAFFLI